MWANNELSELLRQQEGQSSMRDMVMHVSWPAMEVACTVPVFCPLLGCWRQRPACSLLVTVLIQSL